MKCFKYILVVGILAIFIIISKYDVNDTKILADNVNSVMYNNVAIKDNKLDLKEVVLNEDTKLKKESVDFTNTTKEELVLSKDNLTIESKCKKIKIDVYFSKDGNIYNKVVLKPSETVKINVTFSYDSLTESETCDYNIALNISSNI